MHIPGNSLENETFDRRSDNIKKQLKSIRQLNRVFVVYHCCCRLLYFNCAVGSAKTCFILICCHFDWLFHPKVESIFAINVFTVEKINIFIAKPVLWVTSLSSNPYRQELKGRHLFAQFAVGSLRHHRKGWRLKIDVKLVRVAFTVRKAKLNKWQH